MFFLAKCVQTAAKTMVRDTSSAMFDVKPFPNAAKISWIDRLPNLLSNGDPLAR